MLFYKSLGVRYIIVKAATSDYLFNGSYSFPQFTSSLVNIAHAHGILIFGYNRSYGENIPGEIAISDYVFNQGADGFVWDAEAEWESSQTWIGTNGPALGLAALLGGPLELAHQVPGARAVSHHSATTPRFPTRNSAIGATR